MPGPSASAVGVVRDLCEKGVGALLIAARFDRQMSGQRHDAVLAMILGIAVSIADLTAAVLAHAMGGGQLGPTPASSGMFMMMIMSIDLSIDVFMSL